LRKSVSVAFFFTPSPLAAAVSGSAAAVSVASDEAATFLRAGFAEEVSVAGGVLLGFAGIQ
jgi:hypothetical protein